MTVTWQFHPLSVHRPASSTRTPLAVVSADSTTTEARRTAREAVPQLLGPLDAADQSGDDAATEHTADADQLQRVLENLFRNSVEHGSTDSRPQAVDSVEHGGDTVTVRVGPSADGFWVEDDGPGIDADRRQTLFEFGETTHADGTGLGLAIVREVVEAHGWQVDVTDGSAGGARFEVSGVALTSPR
jgi:signal transduction histidine kinase